MASVYLICPTCQKTFEQTHFNQRYCNKGCWPRNQTTPRIRNYTGQRFGMLVAIRKVDGNHWLCQCDCGNTSRVLTKNLTTGNSKSCGCVNRDIIRQASRTHGMSKSLVYQRWSYMMSRCRYPGPYRDKGITVCKRWQKFENFYADMGDPPPGLTLERIDPQKGYSPDNCKWATYSEQNLNAWRVRKANILKRQQEAP